MINFRYFFENQLQKQDEHISPKEVLNNCKDYRARKRIKEIWYSGFWEEIIQYVPKGTLFQGVGSESILGLQPDGNIIKITKINPYIAENPYLVKNINQVTIGDYLIQVQKKGILVNKVPDKEWRSALNDLYNKMSKIPDTRIEDWGPDQIGKFDNEWKVLDSGVLKKTKY